MEADTQPINNKYNMENKNKPILLIDADSLIYYVAYKETLSEAIEDLDNRISRIFEETGSDRFIMYITEGKCFRYEKTITNDYKESRKSKPKPKFYSVIKEYLKTKYEASNVKGLEADDCVVFLKNTIKEDTIICSPDKDVLFGIPGKHYNYQMISSKDGKNNYESKGFINVTSEESNKFLYTQMLMGDATDSIPGIEGVGIKTAEKWISEWESKGLQGISIIQNILSKYIEKYGAVDGICKFHETFRLVYILRTKKDLKREKILFRPHPVINNYTFPDKKTKEVKSDDSKWCWDM